MRSVEKICKLPCSRSCHERARCPKEFLEVVRLRRRAVGVAQGHDDLRDLRGFLQKGLGDADGDVAAAFVDHIVAAAEDGAERHHLALVVGAHQRDLVADLHLQFVGEQRTEHQAGGVDAEIVDVARDDLVSQRRGAQVKLQVDALERHDLRLEVALARDVALHQRRAGEHVGELPRHAHDLGGVGDALVYLRRCWPLRTVPPSALLKVV